YIYHDILIMYHVMFLYFFFQAEDGIRDRNVTGVQTCALPILFWNMWNINNDKKPTMKYDENESLTVRAILTRCSMSIKKITMTRVVPKNPNSSPMIVNMKSV